MLSAVAFSHDGTHIVSGSYDKSASVGCQNRCRAAAIKNGHTKCVSSMAFSHDDIYLVSGSYDKSVQVWDVITGANLQLDCPWASLGRPSANFSGPGPGPRGLVHPKQVLALIIYIFIINI